MDDIAEALEAPNRYDATKGAPAWWNDEDDAWGEFARQLG
jgi:hypothetical protein